MSGLRSVYYEINGKNCQSRIIEELEKPEYVTNMAFWF